MRPELLALGLSTVVLLAACGDHGSGFSTLPALEISAVTPAPNATAALGSPRWWWTGAGA